MKTVIFGGGGFLGRRLAARLAAAGAQVVIATRNRERIKPDLIVLPNVRVCAYQPMRDDSIAPLLRGADAIVNLAGVLHERQRGDFDRIHADFTRRLVQGGINAGVSRFLQASAIAASSSAPSRYLRSKGQAEHFVLENDGRLNTSVLRFSVLFGAGDSFFTLFAALSRLPVLMVPCADALFQPLAVEDAAALIARVLGEPGARRPILHAGGPEVFSLGDIVRRVAAAAGRRPRIVPLARGASLRLAWLAERAIFWDKVLTVDNCRSMALPSVCPKDGNDAEKLLERLTTLDAGLAAMFSKSENEGSLSALQHRARRDI